jgi:DNA (cytosine-5)-methyltransferase 1
MKLHTSSTRKRVNPFYAARYSQRTTYEIHEPKLRVLDLFSGIGGFSLGLERAGMQTVAFCEIGDYCRTLLARHWPGMPIYSDIQLLNSRRLQYDHIPKIDLICGGYPCQPFSVAGKQRGDKDPRHLWPEMHRLIREIRPRWVVCENVAGHIELGLDTVLDDLEAAGYAATAFVIPACAVGAPHRRDRVWIVAHSRSVGFFNTATARLAPHLSGSTAWRELPSPFTCGSNDVIPRWMDRLKALGNAVVPQIPEAIGKTILAVETSCRCIRA